MGRGDVSNASGRSAVLKLTGMLVASQTDSKTLRGFGTSSNAAAGGNFRVAGQYGQTHGVARPEAPLPSGHLGQVHSRLLRPIREAGSDYPPARFARRTARPLHHVEMKISSRERLPRNADRSRMHEGAIRQLTSAGLRQHKRNNSKILRGLFVLLHAYFTQALSE